MYIFYLSTVISVVILICQSAPTVTNVETDERCQVQNRLVDYIINGAVSTINIPECVVSTAYVIRSTVTTDPEASAGFVEVNRGCRCEVAKFTRRQIRIGHVVHKYNEIESCMCVPCDIPTNTNDESSK
ncbi:hypothetical protein CHUAL_006658 [Chamberlinius hualienensis]